MLYKKFHRNYVSQFKKGFKFNLKNGNFTRTVTIEPIIELNLITRRLYVIIEINENNENKVLPLVFSSGRLMYYNVIQEIS